VTYAIDGAPTLPGSYSEADGDHSVTATLTPAAIALGVTFTSNPKLYTLSVNGTVATFTASFTSGCTLPTLAAWHFGATGDPAVCTTSGGQLGTITLDHFAGSTPDETGKVTYTLVNNGTHQTTALGSITNSVTAAPGSYTVKATPTDPADGLVGNTGTTNEVDIPVTIVAASAICGGGGGRLAFTGGTIAWFGFALAGGMLFLGIAFLLMRRRGNRAAE
jgi:hypothetical protein